MKDFADIAQTVGTFPDVSAQNDTSPGAKDGTPLVAQWVSDLFGFFQAILDYASDTPDGNAEVHDASQLLDSIKACFVDGISGGTYSPSAPLIWNESVTINSSGETTAPLKLAVRSADPSTGDTVGNLAILTNGILKAYFGSAYRNVGCQAYASVTTDGAGAASYDKQLGFDTGTSITFSGGPPAYMRLTIDEDFSDANYVVIPSYDGPLNYSATIINRTTSYIDVGCIDLSTGNFLSLSGTAVTIMLSCFGT